ncbi:hypothetical protein Prudu_008586 [Prunus dulcis]|uniref:U3 small nucleolar RNA-associated protein 20 C-terminal domain-containing protein n=1 Tax=Prunus dulcis TaxID=3755 RepID=A0A4Y1R4L0_PRUDU|nr:hypothetical protein Prudu_008586 [Prunus dulcis]
MARKRIKNLKLRNNDAQILSMLDPFVLLLGKCLNSKCLTPLVRLPLPAIESQADNIKAALFGIAESSVNTGSSLMQSCLRLLTVLLRGTKISLSSDQLHLLIQLPLFVDLEKNPSFVALSLLKAIVNRKLIVPEIYDLVTRVAELMVTSQVEPIRHKCSKILLQFLLDYRLSEKRLQQHLDFLLSNLSLSWYLGAKQQLWSAAAQVLGLLVEVMEKGFHKHINKILPVEVMEKEFHKHINRILPVTKCILESTINAVTDGQLDFSNETNIPLWKEAYYSLVMLEKMLHQFHGLCFDRDLEPAQKNGKNCPSNGGYSENMKQLAQEISERVRNKLGVQNYVLVYNDIRKNLKAKRDKRKHEEKRMAVTDPMRNAKRKLRIAEKHRANKKRKMMTMKMGRWTHSKSNTG